MQERGFTCLDPSTIWGIHYPNQNGLRMRFCFRDRSITGDLYNHPPGTQHGHCSQNPTMLHASCIPPGPHHVRRWLETSRPASVGAQGPEPWGVPTLQALEANPWGVASPPAPPTPRDWRALGTPFLGGFRGEAKRLWVQSQFLLAVGKQLVFSSSLIPPPWKPPSSFTEERCHCDGTGMTRGCCCP